MAFVVKDRVRETTLTTGTGTITLAGAVIGYQTFSAIGNGNNTFYTIAGQGTSEWEVGIGTYTASGTTLSRDTILASSNSGSAVNFSAGTKDVFVTYPAGKAIFQNNLDSVVVAANTSSDALRITQTGSGNALLVEDSANPDATPFVVDANGIVGIGTTTPIAGVSLTLVPSAGEAVVAYKNADDAGGAVQRFRKSRGTFASPTVVQSGDTTGLTVFQGYDGANYLQTANITSAVDGTPGTNDMPGRLIFSTTADGASSPTERVRIDSAGNVGIGTTASAGTTLQVQKTLTGSVNSYNIYSAPTNASDVTNTEVAYLSVPSTGFAVSNVYGYWASQGTFTGAVTNQMGFHANSSLTGATNNFGFYSNIASGTGRWNFYANGSANNYFNGSVGIGDVPAAGYKTLVYGSWTGATTYYGVASQGTVQSDVTNAAYAFRAAPNTAAAAFTLTTMAGYVAEGGTVGAGSTVTNLIGFQATSSITTATNNFGFFSDIASGANRWNFYANGSANNYFNGNVGIGTAGPSYKLDIYGGSLGTTAGNQIIAQQLRVLTSNDDKLEFSKIRVSSGADWTTAGWRLQQKVDVTWHGYIQFNGNNNEGISFGTGNSTVSANSITERMRIDSAGNIGIGGAPSAGNTLVSYKAMTGGGGYVYAFNNVAAVNSDATVEAVSFQSYLSTQAASFTAANLRHFKAYQSTIGAGSTVTNQVGYFADASLTGATNNYGFYSNIASGTGRWNFYANGTAQNYFAGTTLIGTTTNTNTSTLVVNGTISQTVSSTQYLVVDQSDIGTGANEIPLNQYLGNLAYLDASSISAVIWQSVKTSAFTAVAGYAYPCNTTSAAFTVTLPASPVTGNVITLTDYAGTFATNNLTINPNGNKINGGTNNVALNVARASVQLVYIDSTQGWVVYSGWAATGFASVLVEYLIIAGGAGGGRDLGAGGGGGGYRTNYTSSGGVSSPKGSGGGGSVEASLSLALGATYSIIVGAGGAGGTATPTTSTSDGSNSTLASVTSTGGGGGGANSTSGRTGGSGGGASRSGGSIGTGTTNQGYNGGTGTDSGGNSSGGGGGAGAVGGNASGSTGGSGGQGNFSDITGSSTQRAGGGGGCGASGGLSGTAGSGGAGGGGSGSNGSSAPVAGSANTGGGGGGGGNISSLNGANGGSGVVIIRIADTRTATFSAGVTSSVSTAVAGYKIYTVTATSTTSETVTFS